MTESSDNQDNDQPEPLPSEAALEPVPPAASEPEPPAAPEPEPPLASKPAAESAPGPERESKTPTSASGQLDETAILHGLIGDPHLLTVVVLIGASALLPVPFLDDVAKGYLERRLIRAIAEGEGLSVSSQELDRLTREPPKGCCAVGCLGKAVLYPVKKLLRKILFFLEIKRSVDQSSTALAEAWLLTLALRRGLWSPGRPLEQADRLREVIEAACRSHGVKPLETAFSHTFRGAKDTLLEFARRFTGQVDDDKAQLDAAVARLEAEERERLAGLSGKLKEALSGVSEAYLLRFAKEFERQFDQSGPGLA